ncbi:ATP-binding cassette domain-containing protein [Clavibacter michiganensis]|uniref:ATP-binding cassette domain-containing protein n=1 Tax=Clavibacter michiganensis TaxID=28447 RepID=A0A399NR90_9MICO|nr:ATP-binding cassette domain-containing protein [Clavibacter michiganensis]
MAPVPLGPRARRGPARDRPRAAGGRSGRRGDGHHDERIRAGRAVIDVTGARKAYGPVAALHDVELHARAGAVTAVVGPNGAGKSTLFRAILGLERLDGGSALVDGAPFALAAAPQRVAGAVIDSSSFHPRRRAVDEVRIAAAAGGIGRRRVPEVLEEVGLAHSQRKQVRALSMGMRQRLAIAVALLGRPRNLILDEPLNGLDVDGIQWVRELLLASASAGSTVLISSHVLTEVERVSDDVRILVGGRIASRDRSVTSAAGAPPMEVLVVTDSPVELGALLRRHGATVEGEGRSLRVRGMRSRTVAELAFRDRMLVETLCESTESLESEYLRVLADARPGPDASRRPLEGRPA